MVGFKLYYCKQLFIERFDWTSSLVILLKRVTLKLKSNQGTRWTTPKIIGA